MTTKIFLPSYRGTFLSLMSLSVATLIFVYIGEYIFGFKPCILCIYQRIPYFLILALSATGYLVNKPTLSKYLCYFCSAIFLLGFLIALYHTGIERGIITEPTSCATSSAKILSIEELRTAIYASSISCKNVEMRIFGFSAAELNALVSFFMLLYLLASAKKLESKK